MPKIPVDYSKTIIYKIEHIDDDSLVYVGHTTNWDKRKCEHKSRCMNEKYDSYNSKLYQMIRNNGGWDMFKMLEVEKFQCNDKREAEKRETEVMKHLKASMNSMKSYRTKEEERKYVKEYNKEYRFKNGSTILEKKKDYYNLNKDKLKEEMKRYSKNHYEKNKDKINEKRRMKYHMKKQIIKHIEIIDI